MTDESRLRIPRVHGLTESYRPAAGGRVRRSEDPLAELARLIGQEDPFADFVAQRPVDTEPGGYGAGERHTRADHYRSDAGRFDVRVRDRQRSPAATADADGHAGHASAPSGNGRTSYAYGGGRALRAADASVPSPRRYGEGGAGDPVRFQPLHDDDEQHDDHGHDEEAYAVHDSHADVEEDHDLRDDPRYARRALTPSIDDDPTYDRYAGSDYDPDYADDAYLPAHGDEFYDEAPRRRLKAWALVTTAAVVIVVLGASGLFAYRAVFGVSTAGAPPKTIQAEAGPTKMVPEAETKSAESGGKRIYDRVGGEALPAGERIVSREERPIDAAGPGPAAPTGTVAASPQPSPQAAAVPAGTVAPSLRAVPAAPPAPSATALIEPRRVRTVTVRADGTVIADPPRGTTTGTTAAATTAVTTAAPPPVSGGPLAVNTYAGQPGQPVPSQPVAIPPARPAPTTATPQSGDNPWADISAAARPPAPAPTAQAALSPPAAPVPQTAPSAIVVQTPPPAGSYVVQVAAQKSEADAIATWQALQQRYPAVLGGHQAMIRRVDLGERGVFYRAHVGPFGSRAQASELCQSLRAAGGECVIQRN